MRAYESILDEWPVAPDEVDVPTRYGKVHVIVSGPDDGIPVLLFHAASMAAVSWAPNVASLAAAGYRTYAVDYIGEAGRSVLDDVDVYPKTPTQIGRLYTQIADGLGLGSGPAIGASAGGHAAMRYALENPDRVTDLALLGPMGIVPLGLGAVTRMMLVNMFPSERRIERSNRWALGGSPNVPQQYRTWFSAVLRGIASPPRVGRPRTLQPEEMGALTMPVLLVLGDDDNLVGDPARAARRARSFPNIHVEVARSGHLVGVEQAGAVNRWLVQFLTSEDATA